jgi:methylenetetrahydrofolate reductase (NADPH)
MPRFSDFYRGPKPVLSIEIFPPKTEKGVEALIEEIRALKSVEPAFVSVTYGAFGTTRDLTKDLAVRIYRELNLNAAFHFTCVGSGRDEIRRYVTELAEQGLDLVVALRGDKPAGMADFTPPKDGFRYANELVGYLSTLHPFSMAVAGYPEKHVEAASLEDDVKNLKRKVEAGAEVILTQLFFSNIDYYNFVERVRAVGIRVPVVPGILPIQNLKQVQRITSLCGAHLPKPLFESLSACDGDEDAMREVGLKHAISQCRDLLAHDVPGIHFYSLNKAYSVLKIVEACRGLLRG